MNNIFFELFMMIVVILNTVTILIYFFSYDQDTLDTIDSIDQVIIWIYCAEAVMKILGNGLLKYFKDGWNLVDFFSTVLSVVLVFVIDSSRFSDTAKTARALRSLRVSSCYILLSLAAKSFETNQNSSFYQIF